MEHRFVLTDGHLYSLLASFDVALPSERRTCRNRAECTERSRFLPPHVEFCSVGSPLAGSIFEWAITQSIVRYDLWHHIDQLCIHALASARASLPPHAARSVRETAHAQPQVQQHFYGPAAREPMGLSSCSRLLLLACQPHCSRSRVFSQIFLGLSPRWRFWVFCLQKFVDRIDRLTLMKHLDERKLQLPCGMLFQRLAQKQVQIWGRHFSSIVGYRSQNFAQRWTLVYGNRINRLFGNWEKKYREREFWALGKESSQNEMALYTWKDSILAPECLAYWSLHASAW